MDSVESGRRGTGLPLLLRKWIEFQQIPATQLSLAALGKMETDLVLMAASTPSPEASFTFFVWASMITAGTWCKGSLKWHV